MPKSSTPINDFFVDHAGVGRKTGRGGYRPGAGAPTKHASGAMKQVKISLTDDQLAYLAKWSPNTSQAVRDVLDRAMKMWPKGV